MRTAPKDLFLNHMSGCSILHDYVNKIKKKQKHVEL